jgi:hypothetical protein
MEESKMNWAQRLKAPEVKFPKNLFTFYLSHPFVSREHVRKWELDFEEKHPKIALINPFYDVEGEGREDVKARDEGKKFKKLPGYNWRLVARDKIAIEFSRGILGIVDHNSGRSIGTIMEFVYGRGSACNPKLLICTNKHLFEHPWLRTHFHKIYPSFEAFEKDAEAQVARVKKKWGF